MILETIIGAAIGSAIGSTVGSLARRSKKPGSVAAMCSCFHGFGIHEDGKACGAEIERERERSDHLGGGMEWVPCPCTVYDGLEPLPRVWAINKNGDLT
jgi:hypothetical protein